jgi:hypothetical protein
MPKFVSSLGSSKVLRALSTTVVCLAVGAVVSSTAMVPKSVVAKPVSGRSTKAKHRETAYTPISLFQIAGSVPDTKASVKLRLITSSPTTVSAVNVTVGTVIDEYNEYGMPSSTQSITLNHPVVTALNADETGTATAFEIALTSDSGSDDGRMVQIIVTIEAGNQDMMGVMNTVVHTSTTDPLSN